MQLIMFQNRAMMSVCLVNDHLCLIPIKPGFNCFASVPYFGSVCGECVLLCVFVYLCVYVCL